MKLKSVVLGLALAFGTVGSASALVIDTGIAPPPAETLANAVLGASSGITIVGGSQTLQGVANQYGTYTGFNLAPSSGSTPTLTLPDGIVLTSGSANLPLSNTTNQFNPIFPGTGGNANLTTLSGSNTNDANTLKFSFTVAPGQTSVSAKFVFGTDEFPTQQVTDIFGFFVDGVNFAKFPSGELISNTPGNPTNFILNPVGGGLYGIEYNGLTQAFTVIGLLDPTLTTHTIEIAVADTGDNIFDSGVFIGGLQSGTDTGGGGICTNPNGCNNTVPEPSSLALLGLAMAGLGFSRRKRAE